MTDPNSQTEKPEENRRFNQEQYEMLKRCSDKKDVSGWNEWRKGNPQKDVCLEGANLVSFCLDGAYFCESVCEDADKRVYIFGKAYAKGCVPECIDVKVNNKVYMSGARLHRASLKNALFWYADLEGADLNDTHIEGAEFWHSNLKGTDLRTACIDNSTMIWRCELSRSKRKQEPTNFAGVDLASCRMDPAKRRLLEYVIRRHYWRLWYRRIKGRWSSEKPKTIMEKLRRGCRRAGRLVWTSPVRLFWSISDYGRSTGRIISCFFGLAFAFALVYSHWRSTVIVMVNDKPSDIQGLCHAVYFSVVTMTTLGFGDIAANPNSWQGQTLLMVQVLLGYVLLAALVTRFAVLFTAGGPAGEFSDDKTWWQLWKRV